MKSPKSLFKILMFTLPTEPASSSIIYLKLVPRSKGTISLTCQNKKSRRCRGLFLPAVHAWDFSGLTLGRFSVRLCLQMVGGPLCPSSTSLPRCVAGPGPLPSIRPKAESSEKASHSLRIPRHKSRYNIPRKTAETSGMTAGAGQGVSLLYQK